MYRTNSQPNQTDFEGWHYHASFGLVKMRRIWGQDLQKTYPIATTTLPTPTTPLPDSDSELHISPNMDTSYISQTEQELSLISDTSSFTESSAPSFLLDSESAAGVDFPGLGLFGVVTDDCHIRPVERMHRPSRSRLSPSHTVISEALLDEVYATFCNTSANEQKWRHKKTLTRTQSQPIRAFKTMGHSRSTVSSSLKKTNRSSSGKLECAPTWR